MKYFAVLLLLVALGSSIARSQDSPKTSPLTNKDVTTMASAGLPPGVIVAKIKSSDTDFDTSPASLADLKKAGVPNEVILAMVEGSSKTAPKPAASNAAKPDSDIPSGKPRLYITDSQSWLMAGGWGASNGSGGRRHERWV